MGNPIYDAYGEDDSAVLVAHTASRGVMSRYTCIVVALEEQNGTDCSVAQQHRELSESLSSSYDHSCLVTCCPYCSYSRISNTVNSSCQ